VNPALNAVCRLALAACAFGFAAGAAASSDPFVDFLQPGALGIGYSIRYERSMYQGGESGGDHTLLYLYEGEHAFILQNDDRRVIFMIPYGDLHTLVGTTDVQVEDENARP